MRVNQKFRCFLQLNFWDQGAFQFLSKRARFLKNKGFPVILKRFRLKQQGCLEDCIGFSGSVCPGLEPDLLYCCLEFHSKCDIIIVYQIFFKQIAEKECHFLFNAPLKYQKFNEYPKHLIGKMHYKYLYKKLSRSLNTKSFLNFLLSLLREALF